MSRCNHWVGDIPQHCDLCNATIIDTFIDGKIGSGPWAIMCIECHAHKGYGLGMGKGQQYHKRGEKYIQVDI